MSTFGGGGGGGVIYYTKFEVLESNLLQLDPLNSNSLNLLIFA